MLSIWAMKCYSLGRQLAVVIRCLFTKQICLSFECKNESANSAWCFGQLWEFEIRCHFSFAPSQLQLEDMPGSFFFLPCIFSTFLPVSFSNSFSIFFRRLSSLFFRFFFFVLSRFLSIKDDWNLLPPRYLSSLKYLSLDDKISVSLSDSLLLCMLQFFFEFFLSFFFWFSFNCWF